MKVHGGLQRIPRNVKVHNVRGRRFDELCDGEGTGGSGAQPQKIQGT